MDRQVVAAFDFDGTLTKRDSLPSFLKYLFGNWKTAFYFMLEVPTLLGFLMGLKSRQETKEKILKRFLSQLCLKKIQEKGQQFAEGPLNALVRKEGIERLKWHLEQGHCCVLISANLDLYLVPWSKFLGFHHILCSQVAAADGKISGELKGTNCWGLEKVRRLTDLLGPKENYVLYAYGDSLGDHELLELADHAYFKKFSD